MVPEPGFEPGNPYGMLDYRSSAVPAEPFRHMVEEDGAAPPELSQQIYSLPRYYLRYTPLYFGTPTVTRTPISNLEGSYTIQLCYRGILAGDRGFEPLMSFRYGGLTVRCLSPLG